MSAEAAMEKQGDVTQKLRDWGEGRPVDTSELFDMVYPQLRTIAGALFRGERAQSIMQPTSVVNELFLKLVRQRKLEFQDRQHFYSFSARLMPRILIDYSLSDHLQKPDGGTAVPLHEAMLSTDASPAELIDLARVLEELEHLDERKCRMVELRYMLGFTAEETADLMQLSKASVDRDLRFVRGWLQDKLKPQA